MLQCITILIVSITGILYLIHYSIHGSRKGKPINKIPGPYAWPVIGNVFKFMVPIETTMGFTSEVNSDGLNEYRSCVSEMGEISVYRLMRPWTFVDWMFRFFQKFKEQVRILKVLHGFSTNIINERKRYHEETGGRYLEGLHPDSGLSHHTNNEEHVQEREEGNSDHPTAIVPGQGKRRLAMLDLLISAAKREASIDDEGIREEVDTFIFEADDTTAMALCFTLMLLAENKQIQDEARAEVDAVFGRKDGRELSLRELQGLAYLERCIKESLRLFPKVSLISRYISEDLQLKHYLIPSGTIIDLSFWELHRDPNFWPNPEVFDPDRFLPDQVKARHSYAFAPFSAGPRNCIGQKFAILELKALVGIFLRNFYLEPIDLTSVVRMRADLVLRTMNPVRIKLVRRSRGDIPNFS